MLEIFITTMIIIVAVLLIKRKHDPKVVMFLAGIMLMCLALLLGKPILADDQSTALPFFDIFKVVGQQFTKQLTGASFILMLLFGYTTYMDAIKANQVTIQVLSAPLRKYTSNVMVLPLLFIIGNLLCLIIPSASSLSVLLMSTIYPVLVRANISPLGVAAIIATSATIAPTPLGADNIVASEALGISVTDYVFNYHAKLSIPILIVMGITHLIWQHYLDRKDGVLKVFIEESEEETANNCPVLYGVLPLLPLVLMIVFGVIVKGTSVGIVEVTFLSFIIAITCEIVRTKSFSQGISLINEFFLGMGKGFTLVATQVISALIFVEGLKCIGVITILTNTVGELEGGGGILILLFCLFAFLIGLLSGSGLALFYAFVEIMPTIALSAHISPVALALPMQFVSHFVKSVSPVAPTVIIISSMMNVTSSTLIKRTAIPVAVSILVTIVASLLLL